MLKRKYWFSEWDYCESCRFFQHYERFKVKSIEELNLPQTSQIKMF